jgi:hypothetical protein
VVTDARVRQLLDLLDDSFEGDEEHSLMANLGAVDAAHWHERLPGSERTVAGIAWHAGAADYIYGNHAFGDGSLRWGEGLVGDGSAGLPRAELMAWVARGYGQLRQAVEHLTDGDLDIERPMHHGGRRRTDRILFAMIEHHAYHAGEVNHLRALLTGTDRWAGS